jgi:hypothetical protein
LVSPDAEYEVVVELVEAVMSTHVEPEFIESDILYPVMGEPPLEAGAVQVRLAEALAEVAPSAVGAPGTL